MTSSVEEIRERCKTMTKHQGEDKRVAWRRSMEWNDGDETQGAAGREEYDEWEDFGSRKLMRKHDPRQPSQQEKRHTR